MVPSSLSEAWLCDLFNMEGDHINMGLSTRLQRVSGTNQGPAPQSPPFPGPGLPVSTIPNMEPGLLSFTVNRRKPALGKSISPVFSKESNEASLARWVRCFYGPRNSKPETWSHHQGSHIKLDILWTTPTWGGQLREMNHFCEVENLHMMLLEISIPSKHTKGICPQGHLVEEGRLGVQRWPLERMKRCLQSGVAGNVWE